MPAPYTLAIMKSLVFVTGNAHKFDNGSRICNQHGIELHQKELDITEIQDNDGELVARDKAQKVYNLLQEPLIITDDSWIVPGLGGFPGVYMHAVNEWFTSEDWLRLTKDLEDRRIIMRQFLVYQDKDGQRVFVGDVLGTLLKQIQGASNHPNLSIIAFDNSGFSVAEQRARGESLTGANATVWHEFAPWYTTYSGPNT
jgi:non-canonical purine NTP pyrophosphatase (RdgB/HAM1 family)